MLYANAPSGDRIQATRDAVGMCETCGSELIARCGTLNIWHWSHRAGDCNDWHETETEWHHSWKLRIAPECREVVIGRHRADIRVASGRVLELQRSSIDAAEIAEREQFYGDMWWLFHVDRFGKARFFREGGAGVRVHWLGASRTLPLVSKPLFCDLGGPIAEFPDGFRGTGTRGRILSRTAFLQRAGLDALPTDDAQSRSHYEITLAHSPWVVIVTPGVLTDQAAMAQLLTPGAEVRAVHHDGNHTTMQPHELLAIAAASRTPRRRRPR